MDQVILLIVVICQLEEIVAVLMAVTTTDPMRMKYCNTERIPIRFVIADYLLSLQFFSLFFDLLSNVKWIR
jgi:hypothetical protein